MVKKPTRHDEPDAQPTQSESITHPPMPPRPQGRGVAPLADDPVSDANLSAIIVAQQTTIQVQLIQVQYLSQQLGLLSTPSAPIGPPPLPPPAGSSLQQISDTLAGASRALGAYISQLETLLVLLPPAAMQAGVNGNGGTP